MNLGTNRKYLQGTTSTNNLWRTQDLNTSHWWRTYILFSFFTGDGSFWYSSVYFLLCHLALGECGKDTGLLTGCFLFLFSVERESSAKGRYLRIVCRWNQQAASARLPNSRKCRLSHPQSLMYGVPSKTWHSVIIMRIYTGGVLKYY